VPNPEDAVIDAIAKLVDWQMSDSPAARREHGTTAAATGYAYNTQRAQLRINIVPVRLDTSPILRALRAAEAAWALARAVSDQTITRAGLPTPECCGNIVAHRPECRHA
jgi:hypothetical protein